MKPLAQAKSRLAPYLDSYRRRQLVTSMLRRVIRTARSACAEVWVLGADESTRGISSQEGAQWRREAGPNINESLRLVFEQAWDAGKAPLFLPGDLPFITSEDLRGLISIATSNPSTGPAPESTPHTMVILSPARKGGGTNAVFIPRRLDFRLQLGQRSFARHLAEANRLGLQPSIYESPGLARDLDTNEDLQEYETQHPGFLTRLIQE